MNNSLFKKILACTGLVVLLSPDVHSQLTTEWARGWDGVQVNGGAWCTGTSNCSGGISTNMPAATAKIPTANAVATDKVGNVYTAGSFKGTTDFDPGTGLVTRTSKLATKDAFVSKLDANGDFKWVRAFGSPNNTNTNGTDEAYAVTVAESGNVYVVGEYFGALHFESQSTPLFTARGSASGTNVYDVFIAKLDSLGNLIWAQTFGGEGTISWGRAVTVDANENVYVGGLFYTTSYYGAGPTSGLPTLTAYATAPGTDAYILKLDKDGNFIWSRNWGSSGQIMQAHSFSIDPAGYLLVSGLFRGNNIEFNTTGSGSSTQLTSDPIASAVPFVAKYTLNGDFVWAKHFQWLNGGIGGYSPFPAKISTDPAGNVFVGGQVCGTYDFDPGTGTYYLGNIGTGSNPGSPFICKLDASGGFLWAKVFGTSNSNVRNIKTDAAGNVVVTGDFTGTGIFDTMQSVPVSFTSNANDIYLSKFHANGSLIWAKQIGSAGVDWPKGLTISEDGYIHIVGEFVGSTDFDPDAASGGVHVLATSATTDYDGFAAKYWDCNSVGAGGTVGPITGPDSICAGTSNTYSIPAIGSALSYTWTLPSGWTGSSTTNSITVTSTGPGTISVRANGECDSITVSLPVIVRTVGTVSAVTGPDSICAGSINTYTVPPVAGALSYTWNLPPGWAGVSNGNSYTAITPGPGAISVRVNGLCDSATSQPFQVVLRTVGTPGAITGPDSVCPGGTHTYSILPVHGAQSYTWELPNGWTGNSATNNITVTSGEPGIISVKAYGVCGDSSSVQTFQVEKEYVNAVTAITGPDSVCPGNTYTYYADPAYNAVSYTWMLPNGWTGASTADTIEVIAGEPGAISVIANGSCDTSAAQTTEVKWLKYGDIIITVDGYTLGTADNTYESWQWYRNDTLLPGATQSTYTVTDNGDYTVVVTRSGCPDTSGIYPVNNVSVSKVNGQQYDIQVYPNPVTNELFINSPVAVNLALCAMDGRELISVKNAVKISVGDLPQGIYLLRLSDHEGKLLKTERVTKR